jgi:TonB family protein
LKPFAVLLAAGLLAAAADEAATRPPHPASDVVDATLRCYAIHGRNGSLTGTVDISVNVGADGRASAVMSPPDTAEHLAAAAQCVGVLLRWQPALQDGAPAAGKAELTVTFPSLPSVKGELRSVTDYCHAPWTLDDLKEGSLNMVARVGTDGRIAEYRLPEGALPWMTEAAKCVAREIEFYPAVLRTNVVESWVIVPLEFQLTRFKAWDAEIAPPSVRSDETEILAAYRHCYPAALTAEARIEYRITVAKTGRVRKAELLKSSGDPALDEAGLCILKNLAFVAARRNGRAVESTLNWPILVRPPG